MEEQKIIEQKEYIKKVKEINKNKQLKYYILTMGCKLNENDSEKMMGMLEEMNYIQTENMKEADLYIINTCCVRENAEEKVFGKLGELKAIKDKRDIIIAIGGCMMQEEHIQQKIKKSYPFVDIMFGTHTLYKLPEDIYITLEQNKKIKDILDIDGEVYEGIPIKRTSSNSASVTIMYGCNNFCTYCIVPYVRGRERSRTPQNILQEIEELAKKGYKEVTLLGQNVNSYNGGEGYKFANLLRDVEKIDGIETIKFVSPHPKDFTDDVIEAIKDSKKISKLLHVPLQSGSTNVLKVMNRKYTKEQYLSLVQKIKKEIPDIAFSTDIIVGFPGETEEDFEDTLDVAEKVNFEQIFMFIYSRRVGTPADKMENQIPEEIKHKRFNRLKELYENKIDENNKKYIGTVQKVLVEGTSRNNEDMLTGRTDTNKVIIFKGSNELIGEMINIKIISEHKWYLKGELLNES
ncbi:MAG: tRNA (N6-isopentenyl adenosine(37)-C2)-methylthiotransferase MiaB [Clostridia bacterium]|nr:tRNA (N6-isopentenyl adenosine(37)-C2)-methylthiotransferase MiaB [Clostridia bacterium]